MCKYTSITLKFLFALLLLCCPAYSLAAEAWVSLDGTGSTSGVRIATPVSKIREVITDIYIPGMKVKELIEMGTTYHDVTIPGAGQTSQIGKPQLPMVSRYIVLPEGATASTEVLSHKATKFDEYRIYPVQPPRPDTRDAASQAFALNQSAYNQNNHYPADMVQLEGPFVIRGRSVVLLKVFPIQYNPVERSIRASSHIRVRITFEGGQHQSHEERLQSPSFDKVFNRLLLNAPGPESALMADAAYHEGNLLLIITHPDFQDAAETLATWKREKGIYTEVRNTAETGGTASAIQAYIQNAYDNWHPAPTYVMLIGDAEFIPPHYETTHPYTINPQGQIGTDIYYATVDGADYFPDLSMGRISVDTPIQADKRINDIINYERSPVTGGAFYRNTTVCAYFQHADSGNAKYRYAQTSEDVAQFLSMITPMENDSVNRIYYAEPSVEPLYWSNWALNFGGGLAGNPGDPIPPYLRKDVSPFFQWNGDATDISNAINAGTYLVTHRDHGSAFGWGEPYYHTAHVNRLTNGDRLPVVWSVNCQTGWFDNETDDIVETLPSAVHFTEAWERNPHGGAIGLIGATRVSYSPHNDIMMWGWMDAIWPEFMTYHPLGMPSDEPLWEMGAVLNYGKYYFASLYSDNIYRKIAFEMYHWFGDPTMEIWTAEPRHLSVTHDTTLMAGQTEMDVSVSACDGALICVSKEGHILGRSETTGGRSTIRWTTPLEKGDNVLVTVTGHNYRPYQRTAGTIDICECNLDRDADCDGADWWIFANAWGSNDCNVSGAESCACDLNHDSLCDLNDWFIFIQDWGRADCPIPPPKNLSPVRIQ